MSFRTEIPGAPSFDSRPGSLERLYPSPDCNHGFVRSQRPPKRKDKQVVVTGKCIDYKGQPELEISQPKPCHSNMFLHNDSDIAPRLYLVGQLLDGNIRGISAGGSGRLKK